MADLNEHWSRYLAWNKAIADVVYGHEAAGLPTYLDLEDELLDRVRDAADPDAADSAAALVAAVRGTLRFGHGPAELLLPHVSRVKRWARSDPLEPPPSLALLAVLSLAAENMRDGDGMAANNYYSRLAELLGIDDDEQRELTDAYRRRVDGQVPTSEFLWRSLTDWLELLEGNRGLPTAFAAGHAHIGLPLSQALVRHTDRERLHHAFELYGLAPHSSLPPAEMEALLGEWMSRTPCPASNSFERLWKHHKSARDRIIEVARYELESWDGVADARDSGSPRTSDTVRLLAVRRGFPRVRLDLGLAVPARTGGSTDLLDLLDPDDDVVGEVDFVATSSGWLTLADPASVEAASMLMGETRLRRRGSELTLRRRPRRLVPLRHDDLLQSFLEVERVSLGEEHMLLAHVDVCLQLDPILAESARPGFRCLRELVGLPSGWALYEGVQILSSIPEELLKNRLGDLNVLQPLASTQVVLDGGLKIPGNIPKWSTRRPPELRVTADDDVHPRAVLRVLRPLADPPPDERTCTSEQPVLVWPLSGEHLPDGDYEIEVSAGDGSSRTLTLRLRTADNPAVKVPSDESPLRHVPSGQLFGLSAQRLVSEESFVVSPDPEVWLQADAAAPDQVPGWRRARAGVEATMDRLALAVPAPAADSCMVTGAHYYIVEQVLGRASSVEGVCRKCGFVKRFPTRARRKSVRRVGRPAKQAPRVVVQELQPVSDEVRISWELGFDTLCHVGEGPLSALSRVASQIEAGELFGDAFARRLEMLGHIELERDPQTLQVRSWSVVDPTIVGMPDGSAVLAGFRSDHLLAQLEDGAYLRGIELDVDADIDAPARVHLPPIDHAAVDELVRCIEDSTDRPARFVPRACYRLAAVLPPLSELIDRLPVTTTIGGLSYERWDVQTARFKKATDAGAPGGYRLRGFGQSYVYRRPEHLGSMSAIVGNNRLVKYAAALDAEQSLLGYDEDQRLLFVPLGAELPGLFGRAAVLASGRPPHENVDERVLEYRDVPADLAAHLNHLLMS
jgi:hypothetical protein